MWKQSRPVPSHGPYEADPGSPGKRGEEERAAGQRRDLEPREEEGLSWGNALPAWVLQGKAGPALKLGIDGLGR